jgi:undecaprenyl diphosphate synthase
MDEALHVALIMDGNGRWASTRGLPRVAGHQQGVERAREIVRAAPACGVRVLTLYAFASENWQRPVAEVRALFALLAQFLEHETPAAERDGVRVCVIGRRDRLPPALAQAIATTERRTRRGRRLLLRLAVDYSARDVIARAARAMGRSRAPSGWPGRAAFGRALAVAENGIPVPPVDLLVRTGGEQRLSDFLLWECAYAELLFLPMAWPDFGPADLAEAVASFRRRVRRFGALPQSSPGSPARACPEHCERVQDPHLHPSLRRLG